MIISKNCTIEELTYQPETIVFLDFSLIAQEYIRDNIPSHLEHHTFSFVLGNASTLPFRDGSVDCVLSFWGLAECFPFTKQCINEIDRILKPGGALLDTTLSYTTNSKPVRFFRDKTDAPYVYINSDDIDTFYQDTRLPCEKRVEILKEQGKYLDVAGYPADEDDVYTILFTIFSK